MKKQNKTYKNIITFILSILLIITSLNLTFATSNTIYIDSEKDLILFSRNAALDSYYDNKTVILRSNIDLTNVDFSPIPTFNGTFDGQGNTISGLSITHSGSTQGLFRYLQENGTIKNLNISGNITPSGSQSVVGSLVGNNKVELITVTLMVK